MLTERLWKEMLFILILFWGKNYLKKSSDLAFLDIFSDFGVFELKFFFKKLIPE